MKRPRYYFPLFRTRVHQRKLFFDRQLEVQSEQFLQKINQHFQQCIITNDIYYVLCEHRRQCKRTSLSFIIFIYAVKSASSYSYYTVSIQRYKDKDVLYTQMRCCQGLFTVKRPRYEDSEQVKNII